MKNTNGILNDLVVVARDGKDFYEHAAPRVDDPELKALFTRMASLKGEIVQGLSSEIKAGGDTPAATGSWTAQSRKLYTDLRALLGDRQYAYVAQLEESEDRLLKALDQAMKDKDTPPSAVVVMAGILPGVRQCHEIMRTRKLALKKAA